MQDDHFIFIPVGNAVLVIIALRIVFRRISLVFSGLIPGGIFRRIAGPFGRVIGIGKNGRIKGREVT